MTTHVEAKLYLSLLYINIKELESLYSFKNLKMVRAPLKEHERGKPPPQCPLWLCSAASAPVLCCFGEGARGGG